MGYPKSEMVNAGEATLASAYNNLRDDAIYLGGSASENGTLGSLLREGMSGVRLLRTSELGLSLEASASEPCCVMIDGRCVMVQENLHLTINAGRLSGSGMVYVFAEKNSEGGGFALDYRMNAAAGTGSRQIGQFYWDGSGILAGSLGNAWEWRVRRASGRPEVCQGRLSLNGSDPAPMGDVVGVSNLYYLPYGGRHISLYDSVAGAWNMWEFEGLVLNLNGYGAGVYDVFVCAAEGELVLELTGWTDASNRGAGLSYRDGILVKGSDHRRRYVGSVYLYNPGLVSDCKEARDVWNYYNRVRRGLHHAVAQITNLTIMPDVWSPYGDGGGVWVGVLVGWEDCDMEIEGLGAAVSGLNDEVYKGVGIGMDIATSGSMQNNRNVAGLSCLGLGGGEKRPKVGNGGSLRRLGRHRYYLMAYSEGNTGVFECAAHSGSGQTMGLSGYVMG